MWANKGRTKSAVDIGQEDQVQPLVILSTHTTHIPRAAEHYTSPLWKRLRNAFATNSPTAKPFGNDQYQLLPSWTGTHLPSDLLPISATVKEETHFGQASLLQGTPKKQSTGMASATQLEFDRQHPLHPLHSASKAFSELERQHSSPLRSAARALFSLERQQSSPIKAARSQEDTQGAERQDGSLLLTPGQKDDQFRCLKVVEDLHNAVQSQFSKQVQTSDTGAQTDLKTGNLDQLQFLLKEAMDEMEVLRGELLKQHAQAAKLREVVNQQHVQIQNLEKTCESAETWAEALQAEYDWVKVQLAQAAMYGFPIEQGLQPPPDRAPIPLLSLGPQSRQGKGLRPINIRPVTVSPD